MVSLVSRQDFLLYVETFHTHYLLSDLAAQVSGLTAYFMSSSKQRPLIEALADRVGGEPQHWPAAARDYIKTMSVIRGTGQISCICNGENGNELGKRDPTDEFHVGKQQAGGACSIGSVT